MPNTVRAETSPMVPPRSSFSRIHKYSQKLTDPEDSEREMVIELTVTRTDQELDLKLSRTARGRTTEISLTLSDDERRELGRLLT